MILAVVLYALFTVLAVAGLYWILGYHYGWRVAAVGSALLLVAFLALAWFVRWIVVTEMGAVR